MTRTKEALKRIGIFSLAVAMTVTSLPVSMTTLKAHAEETTETEDVSSDEIEEKESFTIRSEEDWMDFTENCRLDEWSRNRVISLGADIDLSKEACSEFYGVSSFSGTFFGNGHTIKGLSLSEGTEAIGLFRYLEKEGTISNLKVEGEISSTDPDNRIGGIVGVNAGKLERCEFNGTVTGKGTTGGLAGYNGASGTISKCSVSGSISSAHSVGGACGENRGIVSETTNNANINADSSWFEDEDSGSSTSFSLTSIVSTTTQTIQSGSDIGGIAGYSDGIIAGCTNNGIVGYQHTGRNVGGIAGRHGGTVLDCENDGKVYGKQDVGGIVGQFEPKTTQEESVALTNAVDELHDDIEIMVNDMDDMSDAITSDIGQMTDTATDASKTTEAITDELRDVIEKNIDVLNDLAGRVDYVCDHLPDVLDNLDDALDAMSEIGKDLSKIADDVDVLSKLDDAEYDPAKYNRLSLVYGQGGSLSTSSTEPAEGDSVTITVYTDSCYVLKSLTMTPYGGEATDITSQISGGTYTFTMPADNLTFKATYSYTSQYYAYSNPGGRVSFNGDSASMTIKATPNTGYTLKKLTVGGTEVATTETSGSYEATVARDNSGKPILAEAEFEKKDVSENDVSGTEITTVSSTGGSLVSSAVLSSPGEEITFGVTSDSQYCLKSLTINGTDMTDQVSSGTCKYTIPEGVKHVTAEATFAPIMVVITGNPGGAASYSVTGEKVTVTVSTQTGFILEEPLDLTEEDGTAILYEKSSATTTTYTFDVTNGMKNLSAAYLTLNFTASSSTEIVSGCLDRISENTKIFTEAMNQISAINTRLNEIMDDGNGGTKEYDDLTESEKEEVRKLLKQLSDEMVIAGNAAAQIMTDLNTVMEIMRPYLKDALEALSEDLDSLSKHYTELTSALQGASKSVRSILTYLNALDDLQFVNLSSDFNTNTEKLSLELNQIIEIMKKLNNDTNHYTDLLEDDMNRVNDQLNVVFNLLIERVNNLENLTSGDMIEDHSADEDNEYETSTVSSSVNNGLVNGDTNIGGIAGAISREGDEASGDGDDETEASFGAKYIACALLDSCTNNGFITVRTENGGGIAGSMSLGYVKNCTSEGSVCGEAASVLGGIAGYSAGTISGCKSLTQLSGTEYLGGIAGKANTIKNCLSMAYVSSYDAIVGAISGAYLPAEDESDDITVYRTSLRENYQNNYYTSSTLFGIDEVSYASVAEPVTYNRLVDLSNRSTIFTSLDVIFLDEEENVVKRQRVEYGDSTDVIEYPEIAADAGDYFEWSGLVSDTIEGNLILRASATANVVVLESDRNGDGKTIGYAEGTFTERSKLNITEITLAANELPSALNASSVYKIYQVTIENSSLTASAETPVRLLIPGSGTTTAYEIQEGKWKKVKSEDAGRYIQVTLTGTEGIFCIASQASSTNWLLIGGSCGGALVLAGVLVTLLKKNKKKKKAGKAEKENTEK